MMIKEFNKKWDKNKNKLEEYYRTNAQEKYNTYKKIIKLIFEYVINDEDISFNTERIHEINDGSYQGTIIFIVPKDTYQPDLDDYVYTHNYYGSCSGCDTLLGISGYDDEELPNKEQIKDYMTLSLHLLQKMRYFKETKENE